MNILVNEQTTSARGLLDSFITREKLAQQFGVSIRTIDNWGRRRQGPPKVKIGARVYYNVNDVRAFVRKQRMIAYIGGQA